MSQSQTVSFLKQRFLQAGIQLQTRHGQNFLIDLNLQRLLVEAARLEPNDVVLEVGTGTGGLTASIAARAAAVVTVEIDAALYQLASEELIDLTNVTMLKQDALKNKNTLDFRILDAVRDKLAEAPGRQFKLVSNLPYSIATPVISNLLALDEPPATMTVTIQKELADRILARPRTGDYGALSIWLQSQCRIELVRVLPPEVFWPRPKVTSAILHITLDKDLRQRIPHLQFFHHFVRAMFFHRRKFLRSVLHSAYKEDLDKPQADEILAGLGISATSRAEELGVETILALCEAVRSRVRVSAGSPLPLGEDG